MNPSNTIRCIRSGSLPHLCRPLSEFLSLNARIAASWKWKDLPWWYNERATLSIFAAAVWKSGGIAVEEFSTTKRALQGKRSRAYAGRTDLYIQMRSQRYVVEAKNIFLSASGPESVSRIKRLLAQATRDVRKCPPYGGKRLAVVFVAPRIVKTRRLDLSREIQTWVGKMQTIRCSAAAWTFPNYLGNKAIWPKARLFPGVAILIKRVY
jgi:hypothetical protein